MSTATAFRLPAPRMGSVDLLVVAGEHSGDEHAARMVRGLRARRPDATVAAIGGPLLEQAGAQLLHDLTADSVVGLIEVLRHLSFFRAFFKAVIDWVAAYRLKAACYVDYPGLNLRLAEELRRRGLSRAGFGDIRVLYYISPQIWAWKAGRRFTMARDLDAMAVIFPFEVACYADTHLPVEFVGHPFVEAGYDPPAQYAPDGPVLLLPGSRKQAVSRIFPVLLAGFARFRAAQPQRTAIVLYPSEEILTVLRGFTLPDGVTLRKTGEPVSAGAVLTSSGTMSMHCALAGIPGAIVYRANSLTYAIGRALVSVPYLGIANLLLGEAMYPEFIQDAARPEVLERQLVACYGDEDRQRRTRADAERLRESLGRPKQGDAADWLVRQLYR
jgi:lipid-A-disaccharide synthase